MDTAKRCSWFRTKTKPIDYSWFFRSKMLHIVRYLHSTSSILFLCLTTITKSAAVQSFRRLISIPLRSPLDYSHIQASSQIHDYPNFPFQLYSATTVPPIASLPSPFAKQTYHIIFTSISVSVSTSIKPSIHRHDAITPPSQPLLT